MLRTIPRGGGGRQITVAVDLTPKPLMRLYAPGNAGYTAISLTIDGGKGVAVAAATKYPKAEDFLFVPLNERFKVYSAPFRLTRDVTVESAAGAPRAAGQTAVVTITGRLEYQACDDKVCYLPQTLPLTWTIGP